MDVVEPLDVLRTSVRRLTWLTVALAVLVVGLSVAVTPPVGRAANAVVRPQGLSFGGQPVGVAVRR